MQYLISDKIWTVSGPMVEECRSKPGPEPDLPDRLFLEAVLYWAITGIPWRDLPAEFGAGDASATSPAGHPREWRVQA